MSTYSPYLRCLWPRHVLCAINFAPHAMCPMLCAPRAMCLSCYVLTPFYVLPPPHAMCPMLCSMLCAPPPCYVLHAMCPTPMLCAPAGGCAPPTPKPDRNDTSVLTVHRMVECHRLLAHIFQLGINIMISLVP